MLQSNNLKEYNIQEIIEIVTTLKETIMRKYSGIPSSFLINPPTNKHDAVKQYQDFLRRIIL